MPPGNYKTFELLIDRGKDRLEALVIRSPAGDARNEFDLPFSEDVLASFLWQTAGVTRTYGAAEGDGQRLDLRAFGSQLYEAVFAGDVGRCLQRSMDAAAREESGLRISLRIDPRLADLSALPWEYLYSTDWQRYLALSGETPLVRYLETSFAGQLQPVVPPLVVLAVLSNPAGVTPLAVEKEWSNLRAAVAGFGKRQVRLERVEATWPALQARLRTSPAHVVHFIGHGFFDTSQNQGGLLFEDEAGQPVTVPAERFKVLLHDQSALRLVFLNACQGAASGRSDSFAGVAQQLVQQGLPAVVAMQFPVSDGAAITLSREFYRALADGYPVDAAVSEARKAVYGLGDGAEWGTPVLFSRSDDNRLIELPQGDRRPVVETKPFEPETIFIPGGPFLMGSDDPAAPDSEQPQHTVDLPDFRIARYPVTVRQYAAFIKDCKEQPAPRDWFNRKPPAGRLDHPVTSVSWLDALAYCDWLSRQTGRRYTLPSEAEWEKAAGWEGDDKVAGWQGDKVKRTYPWGDEWVAERCNVASGGTTAVTDYATGASGYGVEDLLGNVQEWTRSLWGLQPSQPDYGYPYDPADGREIDDPEKLPALARLVHRGGSYRSQPDDLGCTARGNALPDSRIAWRGFRVAMVIV